MVFRFARLDEMMAIEDLEDPEIFEDKDLYAVHLQLNHENGADNRVVDMARKLLAIFCSYESPVTPNPVDFKKLHNEILNEDKKVITVRDIIEGMESEPNSETNTFPEPKPVSVEDPVDSPIDAELNVMDSPNMPIVPNLTSLRGTLVGGGILNFFSGSKSSSKQTEVSECKKSEAASVSTSSSSGSGKSNAYFIVNELFFLNVKTFKLIFNLFLKILIGFFSSLFGRSSGSNLEIDVSLREHLKFKIKFTLLLKNLTEIIHLFSFYRNLNKRHQVLLTLRKLT